MATEHRKYRNRGGRKGLIYLALPLLYLISQTMGGELGVLSYFKLKRRIQNSYYTLTELDIEKAKLTRNAKLLSNAGESVDLLEEKIKENLGLTSKGELMFKPYKEEEICQNQ